MYTVSRLRKRLCWRSLSCVGQAERHRCLSLGLTDCRPHDSSSEPAARTTTIRHAQKFHTRLTTEVFAYWQLIQRWQRTPQPAQKPGRRPRHPDPAQHPRRPYPSHQARKPRPWRCTPTYKVSTLISYPAVGLACFLLLPDYSRRFAKYRIAMTGAFPRSMRVPRALS